MQHINKQVKQTNKCQKKYVKDVKKINAMKYFVVAVEGYSWCDNVTELKIHSWKGLHRDPGENWVWKPASENSKIKWVDIMLIIDSQRQSCSGSLLAMLNTKMAWTNPSHCYYSPLDDTRERDACPKPYTDSVLFPAHTAGVRWIMPTFHRISLAETLIGKKIN